MGGKFLFLYCPVFNAFDKRTVVYSYRMISDYLIEKYIEGSARR
jgi:tRNA(His) 5'-end guanylyltransferase